MGELVQFREPVIVGAGPDTAYYNIRPTDAAFQVVRQELSMDLQEELQALKLLAQELDELVPTRWSFENQTLMIRDKGGSQFKWVLENDFLLLSIGRGKKTGIIGQVRLSSEYLWHCQGDLGLALSKVHLFLRLIYGEYFLLDQSSLDLATDVLYLDQSLVNVKEQFISRAILDEERPAYIDDGYVDGPSSIRRRWKKVSGLTFGMHTSTVSVVIYNKTDEIRHQSPEKKWFFDIWRRNALEQGVEFTDDLTVWRVEVRFKRAAFREFPDVSGAYDVLGHVRDLWVYGVGHADGGEDGLPDGWLRYVEPTEDTNRARWPVHPAWQFIQRAYDEKPLPESQCERDQLDHEEYLRLVDEELQARPWKSPSAVKRARRRKGEKASVAASASPTQLTEVDKHPLDIKPFIRKRKRQANMERGVAQVVGWLSTLEAWRRGYAEDGVNDDGVEPDISETLHFVLEQAERYLEENGLDFCELVAKKRVIYRLEMASSAAAAA